MIPLENFFRKPDKSMPRISPDGSHLAMISAAARWRISPRCAPGTFRQDPKA